jgi:hypothetical protein
MRWIHAARSVAAALSKLLVIAALALPGPADRLAADSCNSAQIRDVLRENRQTGRSTGGGFCNNNITGSENCGGAVGKIQFDLKLAGTQEIDIVCTSSDGKLCIMADDCQGAVLGNELSDTRIRFRGTAPARDLKLIVADDTAQTLCNASADIDVTCAGYYGGRVLFDSPFEQAFDVEGWNTGACGGCNFFAGALSAGASAFTHREGYDVTVPGTHRARLVVPEGADFDLVLWQWNRAEWVPVAQSETEAALEEVVFEGPAGVYRWEIRALSGSGVWELGTEFPDGKETDREE